jgi:tRNA(adenine34) deaminase
MSEADPMNLALEEARAAGERGEVPVGAVLLGTDGQLLARDGNRIVERCDPTAHAEMLVLRAGAARLGNERLTGTSLYVTLEPCAMCAGAASLARVVRIVFAASDPKGGAVLHGPRFFEQPTCHHRPVVSSGAYAEESAALLRAFFLERRG